MRLGNSFIYERLERKICLSGDVSVYFRGSNLTIKGDGESNQIEIQFTSDGSTLIAGDQTTVNGDAQSLSFSAIPKRVKVTLGNGNDSLLLTGGSIDRNVLIFGGSGDDRIAIENSESKRLFVYGQSGNDVVEVDAFSSRRSAFFFLGSGDDLLAVPAIETNKNLRIFGGRGDDTFVARNLVVSGNLSASLQSGDDQIIVTGSSVISDLQTNAGTGNDFLGLVPQTNNEFIEVENSLNSTFGPGDDALVVDQNVAISNRSRIDGGPNLDFLVAEQFQEDDSTTTIRRFEGGNLNLEAVVDEIFSTLVEADVDPEPFFGSPDELGLLDLGNSEINFVENSDPIILFPDAFASEGETIVSATISFAGFDGDQDLLQFDDLGSIFGDFDTNAGVLSLGGSASIFEYANALATIRYVNSSENPIVEPRLLNVSLFTETGELIQDSQLLRITSVDDALTLDLPAPEVSQQSAVIPIGQEFRFFALGFDPDNVFTYRLDLDESEIPLAVAEPTIDSTTGEFRWTPALEGEFLIRVIATNDLGQSDQESFTISVI